MSEHKNIQVKVLRVGGNGADGSDTGGAYDVYRVPVSPGMSISNVLKYINEHYDGGVAHYLSCRRGVCMGCMVLANGKPGLACMEMVEGDLVLEPVKTRPVIKDLVVRL